jgi:ATP-dependent Clp protease protease subunit
MAFEMTNEQNREGKHEPANSVLPTNWRLDDDDECDDDEGSKKQKAETAKIQHDILKKQRLIMISEVVTPKLTERITSQLLWLNAQNHDPIRVLINTPGGSADDGFAIHDMIRFSDAPVFNISMGLNASAGTIILLSVPKEQRVCTPNARLMLHQPSGGGRGRASDLEITADEILKLRHRANELIARECGRSVEDVAKDTDRDFWLSPEESVDYGLVSRVITSFKEIS